LYLSNKEKCQVVFDSTTQGKIIVVNKVDADQKESEDDQDKLDNKRIS
jgi:hypothetical protein